jgi:HK97 family phage portal protein
MGGIFSFFSKVITRLVKGDIRYIESFTPVQQELILELLGSTNAYVKNWVVNVCVRNISDLVASLPKRLLKKNGDEVDIMSNPIAQQILHKPNEYQTAHEMWTRVACDVMLHGNAYLKVFGVNKSRPKGIYTLFGNRIEPRLGVAGLNDSDDFVPGDRGYGNEGIPELYYHDTTSGRRDHHLKEDIIHVKEYSPTSMIKGDSWLKAGAKKLERMDSQEVYNKTIYDNGVFPTMNFSTDQELSAGQRNALRQEISKNLAGALKAGGYLLTDKGVTANTFSLSPKDLEVVENEKVTAGHVASMLNYPPELLGTIFVTKNVATYVESRKQLYQQAVLPLCTKLLQAINAYFFRLGDMGFSINRSNIATLQPSVADLAGAWWMTPNQKRAAQGLHIADDPAMDKYYIPAGYQLIDDISFSGSEDEL